MSFNSNLFTLTNNDTPITDENDQDVSKHLSKDERNRLIFLRKTWYSFDQQESNPLCNVLKNCKIENKHTVLIQENIFNRNL